MRHGRSMIYCMIYCPRCSWTLCNTKSRHFFSVSCLGGPHEVKAWVSARARYFKHSVCVCARFTEALARKPNRDALQQRGKKLRVKMVVFVARATFLFLVYESCSFICSWQDSADASIKYLVPGTLGAFCTVNRKGSSPRSTTALLSVVVRRGKS